ncbi:MAG: hypothetical protein E6Q66_04755 [Pedobacter sp.]|nr:MAG: hypothetical protein E6Q66_04755 [Pedobacter sp.]
MINTEAVDSMLEELDRCQEKISILEHNISWLKYAQAKNLTHTTNKVTEMLEYLLEQEKTAARFIHDLLAFEYEHLEVNPILKQLHI